jgi:hypothetical protein
MAYKINTTCSLEPNTIRSILSIDSSGDIEQIENSLPIKSVVTSTSTTSSWNPIPPRNQNKTLGMFTPYSNPAVQTISAPFTPITRFLGGVLAPDGYVYGVTNGLAAGTTTCWLLRYPTFSSPTSYEALAIPGLTSVTYSGIVLGPNGKLYLIPLNSTQLAIYTLNTQTWTLVSVGAGTNKWFGGTLAPNGKIYCPPFATTSVLIIDTSNDTINTTTITGAAAVTSAYVGTVLSREGNIYCIPHFENRILKIDPNTNTKSFIAIGGATNIGKYSSGAISPTNGLIYICPYTISTYIKLNTSTDTFTTTVIAGSLSTARFFGSICGPDGRIYFLPYSEPDIKAIDPTAADSVTTITTGFTGTTGKWCGGVIGLDGYIYMMPFNLTTMIRYRPQRRTGALELQYLISSYRNKTS